MIIPTKSINKAVSDDNLPNIIYHIKNTFYRTYSGIYQFLIGSSHNNLRGFIVQKSFCRWLFTCADFFGGPFGQVLWREIDIEPYSRTCPAVFVCVTGPQVPPLAFLPYPRDLPLSPLFIQWCVLLFSVGFDVGAFISCFVNRIVFS